MKRRNGRKLDYSILHSTGKKVYKNQEDQLGGTSGDMDAFVVQVETISDIIDDFLDENPVNVISVMSSEHIDGITENMNQIRSSYRKANKELEKAHKEEYDLNYAEKFKQKVGEIKKYMKLVNEVRHEMRVDEHAASNQIKIAEERQVRFLVDDINRLLLDLEK